MKRVRVDDRTHRALLALYGVLAFALGLTAWWSPKFAYGASVESRPILAVVAALVIAGIAYLGISYLLATGTLGRRELAAGVILGLALRGLYFFSTPIQEDDFYRYLWDGAVTSHGGSPYAFSPSELSDEDAVDPRIRDLPAHSGVVFDRISFPELTTIYPPVAQAAFAATHLLRPWSLNAWRIVILVFDAASLLLLIRVLRLASVPSARALLYWLNPVLLLEAYNSAHMDLLALPFVIAAVFAAARSRVIGTALALALATGAKLWPILLAPLFLRNVDRPMKQRVAAMAASLVLCAIVLAPMLVHLRGHNAGVREYSRRWEMNDALFMPIDWTARAFTDAAEYSSDAGHWLARGAVGAIVGVVLISLSWRPASGVNDLCNRAAVLLGTLFMLTPTQFPWYYLWLLPFVAVRPRASLLLWSATLPLYYLKFHYAAQGHVDLFHTRVVWIEHGPVMALALWEAVRARRARPRGES